MIKRKDVLRNLHDILKTLQSYKSIQFNEKLDALRSVYGIMAYTKQVTDTEEEDTEYYETICEILREIARLTKQHTRP